MANTENLRWLVHGGPGTGKTFLIGQMRQFFENTCQWVHGLDFQIVALQGVMADMIQGDTIHSALGLHPFKATHGMEAGNPKQAEVARRVAHWKWLIIDEISK